MFWLRIMTLMWNGCTLNDQAQGFCGPVGIICAGFLLKILYVKWILQRPVILDNFMFLKKLISRGYSWLLCFIKIFFMLLVSLFRLKLSLFTSALKEYVLWTLKSKTLIILVHTAFLWGKFKVFYEETLVMFMNWK